MRMQTSSRAQILHHFRLTCQTRVADGNRGFRQEFEELSETGKHLPTTAGDFQANREKNRYPYILPYDHCRVRLSIQNSVPHSDYINASFVPGGGSERDFICTQGPLVNTTADFWRMIWEQNVRLIVMVTALRHKDTVLCDRYWSVEPGTVYYGLFQVRTVSLKTGPDCTITTISLRQRSPPAERTVTHYLYSSWPDRGVPHSPASLCSFTDHIRQHLEGAPPLGPAVVHCSAGVGRSGTLVALLWMMQLTVRGIRPDVRAAVEDLRLHRMGMVQTLEQYILVYQCLLYWLSRGSSAGPPVPRPDLPPHVGPHSSSSSSGGAGRRRRHRHPPHHHPQPHPPPPSTPQNDLLKALRPDNLLKRLFPS